MKRQFADLHLILKSNKIDENIQLIKKIKFLGYNLLGFSSNNSLDKHSINLLRDLCKNLEIDYISRIDLNPKTRNELKIKLRKVRRKYEIVCVKCKTKEIARQAAQDRRVDLINFPSLSFRNRFFDRNEAELASNNLTAFEIDAKPLLVLYGSLRAKIISLLRREIVIANDFHVPIVLSSGISESILLRKPREIAALMFLLDMDQTSALDTISTNPNTIVLRNREKLKSSFVAPGIRIIKEGDC
ncbi:hypothetical protein E2P47_03125 [Candidatus Bathyarchaeota archaeon]|nr:hypothetical protein E2P47_03125 [Candidatus Bathyarchaeota archaeon]